MKMLQSVFFNQRTFLQRLLHLHILPYRGAVHVHVRSRLNFASLSPFTPTTYARTCVIRLLDTLRFTFDVVISSTKKRASVRVRSSRMSNHFSSGRDAHACTYLALLQLLLSSLLVGFACVMIYRY